MEFNCNLKGVTDLWKDSIQAMKDLDSENPRALPQSVKSVSLAMSLQTFINTEFSGISKYAKCYNPLCDV